MFDKLGLRKCCTKPSQHRERNWNSNSKFKCSSWSSVKTNKRLNPRGRAAHLLFENSHKFVCSNLAEGYFAAEMWITSGMYCKIMQTALLSVDPPNWITKRQLLQRCFSCIFTFLTPTATLADHCLTNGTAWETGGTICPPTASVYCLMNNCSPLPALLWVLWNISEL